MAFKRTFAEAIVEHVANASTSRAPMYSIGTADIQVNVTIALSPFLSKNGKVGMFVIIADGNGDMRIARMVALSAAINLMTNLFWIATFTSTESIIELGVIVRDRSSTSPRTITYSVVSHGETRTKTVSLTGPFFLAV